MNGKETEAPVYLDKKNFKYMKNKRIKIKYMKNHHNNFTEIDGKVWKEKLENS